MAGCSGSGPRSCPHSSTGLIYAPSVYADTAELAALARVVGSRPGRLYASHIRGEGPTLEAAIAEAIWSGDEGGVPVQISHLKACLKASWPKMGEALRMIETARARGIDVTADMYPYTAGSTTLASLLPVWVHEGGWRRSLAGWWMARRAVES